MPRYRYQAVNRWGDPFTGEREAADDQALAETLAAEGLELREATELPVAAEPLPSSTAPPPPAEPESPPGPSATPADRGGFWTGPHPPAGTGAGDRLSAAEAHDLAEQLAGLSAAGVPLHSGLRASAEELHDGALRRALTDLADRLEAGTPLEEALEQAGGRLPGHLRGLVLAAARSGRIGHVLGEFVRYAQVGVSLRRRLWLSLAYPLFLVGFLGLVTLFLGMVVLPGFKSMYEDFGVSLPVLTWLFIAAYDLIRERGPALLGGLALGALVLWAASRLLLDPASRRRMLHAVPVLGPLWRWTALAEFAHYLGLLVDCDLPLSRALPLAAQGTRDPELMRACRRVADEVAAGRSLSEALSWWRAIPTGLVKLLRWSEGYQTPAEALHMAGALFEARARSQAEFLGAVAVVTAVILVIWGIGLLVVALFMPLITLVSALA